ncbi:MAG TPA: endo-1,4-beta-xylanase [Phycisphaerae bacterium]|nr:endo-1,4-beta-xylanase [Phycisphaerae bacterium]
MTTRFFSTRASLLGAVFALGLAPACARFQSPTVNAEPSLRKAVHGRFLIGTAVMSKQLDDPRLAHLVATQFNCITGENEFKPAVTEPHPGQFNFAPADRIVSFARKHGMKVVGHNLCWHSQTPKWMYEDADGGPLPREAALANLKRHIDAVAGHFRGQVIGWDVVNEAISDEPGGYLRDSPAKRAIGDDYIVQAFRYAHAADPRAELYYNDYGNENTDKLLKTLWLIRDLQKAGIPLTAVGIQSHFSLSNPEAIGRLDSAISAYDAAGVKVMLTELDVEVLPRVTPGADVNATQEHGLDSYSQGLPEEVAREQADFYERVFRVVLKHPGVVTRITLWGTHDGTSWLNDWPVRGRTNYPLLWDRQLTPKPAFYAVIQALTQPLQVASHK